MVVPMVTDAEKVQLCTSSGYYVVYSNKECLAHDTCHNVRSQVLLLLLL